MHDSEQTGQSSTKGFMREENKGWRVEMKGETMMFDEKDEWYRRSKSRWWRLQTQKRVHLNFFEIFGRCVLM